MSFKQELVKMQTCPAQECFSDASGPHSCGTKQPPPRARAQNSANSRFGAPIMVAKRPAAASPSPGAAEPKQQHARDTSPNCNRAGIPCHVFHDHLRQTFVGQPPLHLRIHYLQSHSRCVTFQYSSAIGIFVSARHCRGPHLRLRRLLVLHCLLHCLHGRCHSHVCRYLFRFCRYLRRHCCPLCCCCVRCRRACCCQQLSGPIRRGCQGAGRQTMRTVGHRCEPCVATAAFIKTLIRLQQQERRRRQQQEAAVAAAAAAVTFGASMAAGPDNYGAVGESHTHRSSCCPGQMRCRKSAERPAMQDRVFVSCHTAYCNNPSLANLLEVYVLHAQPVHAELASVDPSFDYQAIM